MDDKKPVKIFVAMPGTTMGERPGRISQRSRNPNVYLELGVRWALKDRVTIPVCQDFENDVLFNVASVRAVQYAQNPNALNEAIRTVVQAALAGLEDHEVDSPVRQALSVVTLSRSEHARLLGEIERVKSERAEELIAAAKSEEDPNRRIDLLRQAVERNPISAYAYVGLGRALRKVGRFDEAVGILRTAVQRNPDSVEGWRELGVASSKGGRLDEAADAFRRSLELDGADFKTWANLGGLYRRLARAKQPETFDWDALRKARDAYEKASALSGNDTYPLLNVARLNLLLSRVEPALLQVAHRKFVELEYLARYAVSQAPPRDLPWKLFDLADTLMFTGKGDEAYEEVRKAIALIHSDERSSSLTTVADPLRDFLVADVLDAETAESVTKVIAEIERVIGG